MAGGRPAIPGKQELRVAIPGTMADRLRKLAAERERNVSELVRDLIHQATTQH